MTELSVEERIAASIARLSDSAEALHSVSDALAKSIEAVERVFQKMNVGLPAWVRVTYSRWQDSFESMSLGYAKVKGKWCVAISASSGNDADDPEYWSEETWPFNEAPRLHRIKAIEKLPDLIDKLAEEADETTVKVGEKLTEADQIAKAFVAAAKGIPAKGRK
jgi:hypothetical protein